MIYQSVPVVLNPDKVFETEGEPAPGVGFKLWQIDEKVGPGDRRRNKKLVPQAVAALYFDGHLANLVKIIGLDSVFFNTAG